MTDFVTCEFTKHFRDKTEQFIIAQFNILLQEGAGNRAFERGATTGT